MTRLPLLLCLLACTASAQRLDRLQRRLDRRDRLGGSTVDLALLRVLPTIAPATIATGEAVTGTKGEAVTYTRASASCTKPDGSTVTLADNAPCVEEYGLRTGPSIVSTVANPLTTGGGRCYFVTAKPTGVGTWPGGALTLVGEGVYGGVNSFHLYVDAGGKPTVRIGDGAGGQLAMQTGAAMSAGEKEIGGCVSAAGAVTIYVNGAAQAASAIITGGTGILSAASTPLQLGTIFRNTIGYDFFFSGNLRGFCAGRVASDCMRGTPSPKAPIVRLAAMGDSITQGYGTVTTSYPARILSHLSAAYVVNNQGIGGTQTDSMVTRWRSNVQGRGYSQIAILGGINDIGADVTADVIWANLTTMYTEAAADGVRPVLLTLLPFRRHGMWTTARQAVADDVNSRIRTYATANGLPMVDTNVLMADPAEPLALKPEYSQDELHPNQVGTDVLADLVQAAFGL